MRIVLLIFIISLIILSFTSLFEVNFLNYSSPIPYSEIDKITFNDFRGFKRPAQTLDGTQEFAFIKTNRTIIINSNEEVIITTYFYPSRSYVFNQHLRNFDLLTHELYHFHIAELITRLFRKEIYENQGKLSSSIFKSLKTKYNDLENEMQFNYDDESYHSYAFKEQKMWESKIDSSLASLKQFDENHMNTKK